MPESKHPEANFIKTIREVIEENLSNSNFGVIELADKMQMSRSSLLRRVTKINNMSVSQFIRQVRLENALEMLRDESYTVTEVSYKTGFSSPSYFIKCFHDHYGYSPGEFANQTIEKDGDKHNASLIIEKLGGVSRLFLISALTLISAAILVILLVKPFTKKPRDLEKSIAVLPFQNDSNDSTNVYLINGLMESILNNLQKIEDLRVVSRTSVEKYRDAPQTVADISKELNVNYLLEGSGQKRGGKVFLHIQLIEAPTDRHLWSQQYVREAEDVFDLQMEIAKDIAHKIEVLITPEEEDQINKLPTENAEAYDLFLKGLDLMYKGGQEDLDRAINYYQMAIAEDPDFARAHAGVAITYFFLDAIQVVKGDYSDEINDYADKALLLDPTLTQGLIAKALYYINSDKNDEAVYYLEKALEYNPNSALVINILSDFYATYIPNTEKYLEYALKGIQLDIGSHDSVTASFIYLHLSNAFIQSGFIDQANKYIEKSLDINPDNLYSEYVKAFILYSDSQDLNTLKEDLLLTLEKDSNRMDVLQEVGKISYYLRDYEEAYKYYKRYNEIKNYLNLESYPGENSKIGVVYAEMGYKDESKAFFDSFWEYTEYDQSIYKDLSKAVYYSHHGDTQKAIEHLSLFSKQENYHYWTILFIKIDPLVDNLRELPEFKTLIKKIEDKFWKSHASIKKTLEGKGLL